MLTDTETLESRADDQQRSREEDLLGLKDVIDKFWGEELSS